MLIRFGRWRFDQPRFGWLDGQQFQERVERRWELSDQFEQPGRKLSNQFEQLGRELRDQQREQDRRDRIDRRNLEHDGYGRNQQRELCHRRYRHGWDANEHRHGRDDGKSHRGDNHH